MPTQPKQVRITPQRVQEMQVRLQELEETLRAIRHGEVDAVVISGADGDRVFTLQGADHPYRVMVETINEGAATLTGHGLVLYANGRFAEMVKTPLERIIGSRLHDIVETLQSATLDELLERAHTAPQKEECSLRVAGGQLLPAYLSLSPLKGDDFNGICLVATDLTEQKRRKEELAETIESLENEISVRQQAETALRQLTGRIITLQDQERRRIARELHDSTAQTLSALVMYLALIQTHKVMQASSGLPDLLAKTMDLAEQASKEIRNLSHLLHPPDLDHVGLIAAIKWHSSRLREMTGIQITLDLPAGSERLPRDIETALFRILQESLENVRRHSRSPVAEVRLTAQEGRMILEVKDHGQGAPPGVLADPSPVVASLGIGVAGMRERMRQLGGRLEITSGEQGTTVTATVPLVHPQSHQSESDRRFLERGPQA